MKRVVIDVDVGTDDAVAIMFFLHAAKIGKIKIEAFVCTNGNTSLENVCKNLVRLLEIAGRTDIPIYRGSHKQLLPLTHEFKNYHGEDGFGDLVHDTEPDTSIIQAEISASAIRRLVKNNPKEISLICVGPLTNLALPMRLYDDFTENIKEIFIMGGNYYGVGNITSAAEFNFFMDPEAASIVFDSVKCPLYLLPWECCHITKISFKWRYEVLGKITSPVWSLIDKAEKSIYGFPVANSENWMPCDSFLALAFLYPKEAILRTKSTHACVELHGYKTRGQVVLDHVKEKQDNIIIIEAINEEFYKSKILELCQTINYL